MNRWLAGFLAASALHAATIRGVVLENQTGRPLARARVEIAPVAGSRGTPQTVRTNNSGAFEFSAVPGGSYLVTASRRGFAPFQYGQKRWKGSGAPIVLDDTGTTYLNIRLLRFGSIAGTILDENDVGLPEHDVIAYRNANPPVIAGRATTDDRGVYRIWGLEPGSYFIRTTAKQYEGGGYLPTFAKEAVRRDDSQPFEVSLDEQTNDANVRPAPGKLVRFAGRAYTYPPAQVTLTLMSDLGPEYSVSDENGNFEFAAVAPGHYELYAEAPNNQRYGGGRNGAWTELQLDVDNGDFRISLGRFPEVCFSFEDPKGQVLDPGSFSILARRREPFGAGKPQSVKPAQNCTALAPGRWEFTMPPRANSYVADFGVASATPTEPVRPEGWHQVPIAGRTTMKFVVASNPASIHGTVTIAGGDPANGAPVFLEAWDPAANKRVLDLRTTRTDTRGQFTFAGLGPGTYRVLSSFDFQDPDGNEMQSGKIVQVEAGRDVLQDLELLIVN